MKRGSTGSLKSGAVLLVLLSCWGHGCSTDEHGTNNAPGTGGNAGSGGASGGTVAKGGTAGKATGGSTNGQGGEAATAGAPAEGGTGPGEAGAGGEAGTQSVGGDTGSGGSAGSGGIAEGGAAGQGGATGTECGHSVDCVDPATGVCANGFCVAGTNECMSDDASDPANDGPSGAAPISGAVGVPVMIGGTICSRPQGEADYFSITLQQGEGISLNIDWVGNADLDLQVIDANGVLLGVGGQQHPELISLTYLTAGTYYVIITRSGAVTPQTTDYTLTSVRTAAAVCTTRADCAIAHGTQYYRGSCSGGVCASIPAGSRAAGTACDSDDDCQSGLCSYQLFESDAQKSVCTVACSSTNDCASLGADFRCTTGAAPNRCIPSCTTDVECGANVSGQSLDPQQPWAYWNCDVGTGSCDS